MYFGLQLPPPEMGFGIIQPVVTVPPALMESAAELINGMYDAMEAGFESGEEDEAFERLPEILMEGMGLDDDEAHDHAEAILEEADRLGTCPWKLAALHMSGVGWSSEEPLTSNHQKIVKKVADKYHSDEPPAEKPEGKLIQFPMHRIRPSAEADPTQGL